MTEDGSDDGTNDGADEGWDDGTDGGAKNGTDDGTDDETDDPFAQLAGGSTEDDGFPEKDPFAELAGDTSVGPDPYPGASDVGVDTDDQDTGTGTDDPDFGASIDHPDGNEMGEDGGNDAGATVDDPFSDLDDADFGGSDFDDGDVFERMEVDEFHGGDVWYALDASYVGVGGEATPADDVGRDHVVDKRTYCQRCPHFSRPPETACTHEEGTIVEVIESEEFRVRNCPMVVENGPRFDHG